MTKKELKNKVLDIQNMGELELDKFQEALCLSELIADKKQILFKAIDIRRNRNLKIADAMVVLEEITNFDEFEL